MSVMASSSFQPRKYHVFLNFYGKDTRLTFTSYLHDALVNQGIQTYIDSVELESGREISPALSEAIENSKIAITIFSENYGSSSWCLDELLLIMQCKENNDLVVIPIFYHIDPSTVRWQNGTFGDGFDELKKYHNQDKMDTWRKALKNAADISGSHRTQSYPSEPEPKLIKKIVNDVLKKLERTSFDYCDIEGLIGIETRFEQLVSLLCIHSSNVRLIGVWGMGGLGKTTLARVVYDRLNSQFHVHCFLLNIRETLEKQGQNYLENKFYSQLFNENNPNYCRERLRSLKALIILDDVDDIKQMNYLSDMVNHDLVGPGSRIIVTTRNKEVLGTNQIYTFPALNLVESHQLFLLHAFNGGKPSKEFEVVLNEVVHYAKGNPLALKILRSFLCNASIEDWYSVMKKLKEYSNDQIDAVLRLSYEGLDQKEKDIFLDIACFFVGENEESVREILDACGLYANLGINVLRKRSLISNDQDDTVRIHDLVSGIQIHDLAGGIQMHDLVLGMAQKIALQKNIEKHGEGKRIFKMDDVQNVLQDNLGATTIRGIILNNYRSKKIVLSSTCFSRMSDLKFLKIYDHFYDRPNVELSHCNYKVDLPEGLATLPSKLVYLYWAGYKSNNMPTTFHPINLVELIMPYSLLEQLCFEVKLVKLRKVDLSYSTKLIKICLPKAMNLKVVNLEGCESLCELSFKKGCKITSLSINGCNKLWNPNINHLETLKNGKHLTSLTELNISNTSIEEVPSFIECLSSLVLLDLSNCSRLQSLPTSIQSLKSLKEFYLQGCTKLENFPKISKSMESLKTLNLSGTGIRKLCMSIGKLVGLDALYLNKCLNLEKLPSLPIGLKTLSAQNCKVLRSISELPANLIWCDVSNCASLETIECSLTTNLPLIIYRETFYAFNCPKLKQGDLWAEARERTQRHAILSKRNIIPKQLFYDIFGCNVEMRWSGNEIPKWMTYRNNGGSSITIDLPRNWYNPNFLGFALCFVCNCNNWVHCDENENDEEKENKDDQEEEEKEEEEEEEKYEDETEEEEEESPLTKRGVFIQPLVFEDIQCKAIFKSDFVESVELFVPCNQHTCLENEATLNSDEVLFFSSSELRWHPLDTSMVEYTNLFFEICHELFSQATFQFNYKIRERNYLIKKCGVHMMYL